MPRLPYIVFTDLDGTLLDHHTYAFEEALPGLRLLQEHGVPVVFCSAKTRAEQMEYRNALEVHDPFVVENGGAVLIEQNYFQKTISWTRMTDGFQVIELGSPYAEIRRTLEDVRAELKLPLQGYGDMKVEDVARLVGLDLAATARAMQREYEETVVTPLNAADRERLSQALSRRGFSMTSGARFTAVSKNNDKGRAARILTEIFRRERGEVITVGIGDSWNDTPLLAATDISLLVQGPDGIWASLAVDGLHKVDGIGPRGWTDAMRRLVAGKMPKIR